MTPVRADALISKGMQAGRPSRAAAYVLRAGTDAEIEAAFAGFAQLKAGALVIGADAFFNGRTELLAALSVPLRRAHDLPV